MKRNLPLVHSIYTLKYFITGIFHCRHVLTWMRKNRITQLVAKICNTGIDGIKDEVLKSNVIITNTLSFSISVIILVIAPIIYLFTQHLYILTSAIIEFFINSSVIFLNYSKKHKAASLTLFFTQCIAISFFSLVFGAVIQLQFMIIFIISIVYLILANKKLRKLCFIGAAITLVFVQTNYYFNFLPKIPMEMDKGFIIQSLAIMGLLFIMIVVSHPYYTRSNDMQFSLKKNNRFIQLFLTQVTHDLRTPLNTIYLSALLVKRDIKLNEQLKEVENYIDQILYSCTHASYNINAVLDLAQIEAGKTMAIQENSFFLQAFFIKIIDSSKLIARSRGIKLKLHLEDMPEVITCDEIQLHHVMTNLVINAIKYADKGSTVWVWVSGFNNYWHIQVKNNGNTISPESLPTIFDLFVRDKKDERTPQGNGVGLFIVKNKVEHALGGTIEVSSENHTTIFTVRLPLKAGKIDDVPQALDDDISWTNIHILMAEDEAMNAMLFAKFFNQHDCNITIVDNGKLLLDKLEEYTTKMRQPDVIILDHQMPVLSGIETLKHLKRDQRYQNIPVIFTTGQADVIQEAKALGAIDVAVKPIAPRDVFNMLKQHIWRSNELLKEY